MGRLKSTPRQLVCRGCWIAMKWASFMSLPAARDVNKNWKVHDPKPPTDLPHIIRVWAGFVVVTSGIIASWRSEQLYGNLWGAFLLLPRTNGAYCGASIIGQPCAWVIGDRGVGWICQKRYPRGYVAWKENRFQRIAYVLFRPIFITVCALWVDTSVPAWYVGRVLLVALF